MLGRRMIMGGALVAVLLASSLLPGQQPSGKGKGRLPPYWNKIGLSDEQRKKVSTIMADYKDKIDALKRDISRLEDEEKKELNRILTDPQKEELKKILANKALLEPPPGPEGKTPKDQKKPSDK